MEPLRGVEDLVDGEDEPVELLAFHRQLLAPCCGERVVPRAAVVLGRAPLGLGPTPQEEALQGRIERAFADLEDVPRYVLQPLGDAVRAARDKGLENQQVERAGQELRGVLRSNRYSMGECARSRQSVKPEVSFNWSGD